MRLSRALAFCLIVTGLKAQEPPPTSAPSPGAPYVEREEKQFNFYPGGKIEIIAGVPGDIRIVGWQKGSVRLEAEKIVYYASPEDAKALLQKFPMRVRRDQTSATIRTTGSPEPPATMEINLTLYVPGEKTDMVIKMDRGDFSIDSVSGWIEVTVREGSLEARSMSNYFSGRTQRGDIHVEMSGNRWRGLEFAAVTQRGSVELQLPADYSAAIQLQTRNGKIEVHYPPRVFEGETIPPEIVIKKNAQALKSSVGEGGAPIKLVTYSGDVTLSLKEENREKQ
jgi:DUF4097 and DUF4098 domain-containing protein YvlB